MPFTPVFGNPNCPQHLSNCANAKNHSKRRPSYHSLVSRVASIPTTADQKAFQLIAVSLARSILCPELLLMRVMRDHDYGCLGVPFRDTKVQRLTHNREIKPFRVRDVDDSLSFLPTP